jgi:mRNA-degrading endonuclease RelE of RelBE toxin-antitoxin system
VNWEVRLARHASRALDDAPAADRLRLLTALHAMETDPFGGDVRRLHGLLPLWRRRVGNWRVLFSPDRATRLVNVAAIVRRTTTTY